MNTMIIIRKTDDGFTVSRRTVRGRGAWSEHQLGAFCGGQLGRVLALGAARHAASFTLADEVMFECSEDDIAGEQLIVDALPTFELCL